MIWVLENNLCIFKFKKLTAFKSINHCVTTKIDDLNNQSSMGFNLGYLPGVNVDSVATNRKKVASLLGVDPGRLIFPKQCHTGNVKEITEKTLTSDLENTDAVITNKPGTALGILTADCVPILLFDPVNKTIAAVHAGWRGTVSKIVLNTLSTMTQRFKTSPADVIVCLGPSISQKNYQVGPEVLEKFRELFKNTSRIIAHVNDEGRGNLNLWEANIRQLVEYGVQKQNIELAGICTFENTNKFYSARKDTIRTGRFGSIISLMP
ncbi:MAG: peptidoglycan editing factor PgeF [Bacteroidales bacterium]|nr:peptidoglycan editing factor PgeF [Bacteroidales bacterium]